MSAPLTPDESVVRRRLNSEFIAGNPVRIELSRPSLIDDGAGGMKPGATTVIASQRFRVVALNREVPSRTTVDGREVQPSYRLVADYDADIQPGDFWMVGSVRYEIVWVEPDHLDATRADVVYGR